MDERAIDVLLVGDKPSDGRLLLEMLSGVPSPRFAPAQAWLPIDALQTRPAPACDIILLDLSQPGPETLAAFLSLQEQAPSVPVVVLVDRPDEALGLEFVGHGAQDCLIKGEFDGRLLARSLCYAIERKRKETALQMRTRLATAVLDMPLHVVGEVDAGGHLVAVSESTARRFGMRPEQLVGLNSYGLLPPDVAARRKAYADQVFQTGELARFEDHRDGVWFDNIALPILDARGQVGSVAFVARDITQLKQTEERLHRSIETARALLNAPTDAVALLDDGGTILDANETMTRRFGQDVRALVGQSVWDLFPEDLVPSRRALVAAALQSGQPVRREDERHGLWLDNVVYPIRHGEDIASQVAVVSRDITERKQMEEELRRSLERTERSQRLLLALGRSVQAVQRAHTPAEVYHAIGEQITGLGYDTLILARTADGSGLSVAHMTYDLAAVRSAEQLAGLSTTEYRFDLTAGGRYQQALIAGEAVFSTEAAEYLAEALPGDARPLADQVAALLGIEQIILVSLRIGDEVHGLLGVSGSGLEESDAPAVVTFANQAAIALSNARLYAEAKATALELEERVERRTRALSASEARYRVLFENRHDALFVTDPEGRILDVNDAACRLLGYGRQELLSLDVFDVGGRWQGVPTSQRGQMLQEMWRQAIGRYETSVVHKTGRLIPVDVAAAYIEQGDRETKLSALRDISERRQAEEDLRRSEAARRRGYHTLAALVQAAQAVQRARTPQEVYESIGSEIERLGYHTYAFDLEGEQMRIAYTSLQPELARAIQKTTGLLVSEIRVPLAPDGFFQPVIERGETALCEYATDLIFQGFPKLGRRLVESLVATYGYERSVYAPLVVGGKTTGVLGFFGRDLTEADLPAVALFASQAGIAIENALLLGELTASRERLQRVAHQVLTAQEEERRRLSRALHDEAGQALTALKIGLELIAADLPGELLEVRRRTMSAISLAGETMDRIRRLAQNLRPPALDSVGLNYTLQGLCGDFGEHTGLAIHYHGQDLSGIPDPASIALYRCLQEALTNVAKHAGARQVIVRVQSDAEAVGLSVEDDGRGFEGDPLAGGQGHSTGIGILGMRERIEALSGTLEIESAPGRGTHIRVEIPFEEA